MAECDEIVTGFVIASVLKAGNPIEAELESIAVMPAEQRNGIGRALLDAVLAWAVEQEADRIRLEVRMSNAAAVALYKRAGFLQTGVRRDYYSNPAENALLMERSLRSI